MGADPCILTPKFRGIYNSICTRVNELEEIELFKIIMSKVENKLDLANTADKNKIFPLWKMIKNFNIQKEMNRKPVDKIINHFLNLLKEFIQKGARIDIVSKNTTIFHFISKISAHEPGLQIIISLCELLGPNPSLMNYLDNDGFTSWHLFLKNFTFSSNKDEFGNEHSNRNLNMQLLETIVAINRADISIAVD